MGSQRAGHYLVTEHDFSRFLVGVKWILAMKANKLLVIYFFTKAVIKFKIIAVH